MNDQIPSANNSRTGSASLHSKSAPNAQTHIEELMAALNPPQRQAASTLNGPLLILAGAGSGKTRVLTFRTVNLILQGLAAPDQVLAVTFTNKAASEMQGRISSLLRKVGCAINEPLWISTFHSICARILREHIHLLDYRPFFGIYDSGDQLAMIKKVLLALGIDEKTNPAKTFASRINSAKTDGLSPADLKKRASYHVDERTLAVYEKYEAEMKRANSLDFADLLFKTHQLFCDYPAVLETYQDKFRYIMVDEYQDTNRIQYLLVQKLASLHQNLCVVGDEDQSIYSWRGADIRNIMDFEKDFPGALCVKLEQNYRSTKTIISAATHVIRNNHHRKDKTLFTENAEGDRIVVREEANEYDEARFVVGEIYRLLNESEFSPKDIAIFYRTNAQSRVLEEQFRSRNIAYQIVGGMKFFERMEIKDILAYMKLILNPTDDIALKRVINVPARGIGKTTIDRLEEFAGTHSLSLIEAAATCVDKREFNAGTTGKLRGFLLLLDGLRGLAKAGHNLPDLYHAILDQTQYVARLKTEDTPEAEARIENLEEFDNAIAKFFEERGEEGHLQTFLEEMALVSDQDEIDEAGQQTVTMMTLHVSKGLEYPIVYIVGLEENLFPSSRSTEHEAEADALEEERRLMYVGMTRAEKKLTLTYARTRKVWGAEQSNPPSRFIKELPQEALSLSSNVQRPSFVDRARASGASGASSYKTHPFMKNDTRDATPAYEDFSDDFPDADGEKSEFVKGMRVRHPSYGVGSVFQVEGTGADLKVSILFNDNTIKKFVAKYARLEKV